MPVAFKERPAKSIIYVATIKPSATPPANKVESGDNVKLYVDGFEVFVTITGVLGDGRFSGKVMGANTKKNPYPELATGAEIAFADKNIFTCSKH